MNTSPSSAAPGASRAWRWLPWLAACICAYLLWPAATAVHVEGFSAQIQSLAMVLSEQGGIASHDLARPLVSQFIFFTRPGVVDLLALGDQLFGYTGDLGFRVLVWCSLAGLLLGSASFATRSVDVPLRTALVACVFTPGLVELGFYFNDNVVSAAFVALALAATTLRSASLAAASAGLLFGMAVLCRIDAVLAGPLLFLVFVLRRQRLAAGLARLALMAFAALAVNLLAAQINGGTLFDGLRVARIFATQHLAGHGRLPGVGTGTYFFGAVTPVLLLVGGWLDWRSRPAGWRRWAWVLAFYVYPALLLLYVILTTLEIRYFLPLLGPVVALHAGRGLQALVDWSRGTAGPVRKRWALGLAVAAAAVSLAPPAFPLMRDGPRVMVGRLWSPALWQRWQAAVASSMATTQEVVDSVVREPVATLVSTQWNDEFYLRLRLFEAGYREAPVDGSCRPLSRYVNGARTVWHVRVQPQYWLPPFTPELSAALPLAGAARCEGWKQGKVIWVTTFGPLRPESAAHGFRSDDFVGPERRPLWVALGEVPTAERPAVLSYPLMSAARFTPQHLQEIADRAAGYLQGPEASGEGEPGVLLDRYIGAFAAR